jgi:hypothetical protein
MRRTLLLALLGLAAAGCPDSLAQRCPPESVPSGSYQLQLVLQQPTPDECLVTKSFDGGPIPTDGSIVADQPPVDSILCAGPSDAGPTVYLVVGNSSVIRQTPFDPAGSFSFVSPPLIQASTMCGCLTDVNETISGMFLGGGTAGFTLGPDGGGLDPQPTGIDGSVLQTLTNPDGGPCVCNVPCAEHYVLTGTPSR